MENFRLKSKWELRVSVQREGNSCFQWQKPVDASAVQSPDVRVEVSKGSSARKFKDHRQFITETGSHMLGRTP